MVKETIKQGKTLPLVKESICKLYIWANPQSLVRSHTNEDSPDSKCFIPFLIEVNADGGKKLFGFVFLIYQKWRHRE